MTFPFIESLRNFKRISLPSDNRFIFRVGTQILSCKFLSAKVRVNMLYPVQKNNSEQTYKKAFWDIVMLCHKKLLFKLLSFQTVFQPRKVTSMQFWEYPTSVCSTFPALQRHTSISIAYFINLISPTAGYPQNSISPVIPSTTAFIAVSSAAVFASIIVGSSGKSISA